LSKSEKEKNKKEGKNSQEKNGWGVSKKVCHIAGDKRKKQKHKQKEERINNQDENESPSQQTFFHPLFLFFLPYLPLYFFFLSILSFYFLLSLKLISFSLLVI